MRSRDAGDAPLPDAAALATHATSYMTPAEVGFESGAARDFGAALDAAPAGLTSSPTRWMTREPSAKMV